MDTVVLLSPLLLLRHPSSSACRLRLLRKQRGIVVGAGAARRRPTSRSWSRLRRRSPSAASSSAAAASTAEAQKKDKDLVFVAGATGRVGSRAVRELIKQGFRVRAAVRNAQSQRAAFLVESVKQMKLDDDDDDDDDAAAATSSAAAADQKLEIVECDLEKQPLEGLVAAIGNASLVVCSIGASEKEILDVTGPYRIDYMATNNLVQAAAAAKVEHFILVTSLGTNRIGFPAFLLNLFWGVLYWKRRAEEALMASGIPYTIIRPGGMERPTDAFKETHNLVLAAEDTYVGGLVSNLQVAELIACMAKNRRAAYCKVVEVVAETTAPPLPMEQLLDTVPSKRELPPRPAEEETLLTAKAAARPLSPYTAHEGLKPPSSPSPTPSSSDDPQVEEAAPSASSSLPASDKGGSTGTASSTTASSSTAPPLLDSNDAK